MLNKAVESKSVTEFPMNQNDIWQTASAWHELEIGCSHGTCRGLRQEKRKDKGEVGWVIVMDDEAV